MVTEHATPAANTALPLAALRRALRDCDAQALQIWQQHDAAWPALLGSESARRAAQALQQCEFEAALQVLADLPEEGARA